MQPLIIISRRRLSLIKTEERMKNSCMEGVRWFPSEWIYERRRVTGIWRGIRMQIVENWKILTCFCFFFVFFCSICQVNILKGVVGGASDKKKTQLCSVINNCSAAHSVKVKLGSTGNITWSKRFFLCRIKDHIYFDWRLIATVAAHQLPLYDGVKK